MPVRTIDRYLIREILPPFFLALGLFVRPRRPPDAGIRRALPRASRSAPWVPAHVAPAAIAGVTIDGALTASSWPAPSRPRAWRSWLAASARCELARDGVLPGVAGADLCVMIDCPGRQPGLPGGELLAKSTESDTSRAVLRAVPRARPPRPAAGPGRLVRRLSRRHEPATSVTLAEKARFVLDDPATR
jgi:hypothetical protein